MAEFIISDTHFSHRKILELEPSRPFNNMGEMNSAIVENWNSVVSKQDKVFHLGDFALSNPGQIESLLQELNGLKYLIKGNHDRSISNNRWRELGFKDVYEYPIIYNEKLLFSHEPLYDIGIYTNVHGHIHSKIIGDGNHINVSVENIQYTPVLIEGLEEFN